MGVNYGVNNVLFPSPVPVGSLVRATATVGEVTELDDGVQVVVIITVEVQGSPKPACIVESISRFIN